MADSDSDSGLREQILAEARTWVGTPFKHQGRDESGIDCIGLLYLVGKKFDLFDYDMTTAKAAKYLGYARQPRDLLIRKALEEYGVEIRYDELKPADIILIAFNKTEPSHVAFYAGDTMIHVLSRINKCCEHRIDDRWRRRFRGFFRYPGLVDE